MDFGPEKFEALDPEVQAFLRRLDRDDVRLLEKSIDLSRRVGAAASVVRWVIITVAAIIVTVAGLGDAIAKIVKWFFGAPH